MRSRFFGRKYRNFEAGSQFAEGYSSPSKMKSLPAPILEFVLKPKGTAPMKYDGLLPAFTKHQARRADTVDLPKLPATTVFSMPAESSPNISGRDLTGIPETKAALTSWFSSGTSLACLPMTMTSALPGRFFAAYFFLKFILFLFSKPEIGW